MRTTIVLLVFYVLTIQSAVSQVINTATMDTLQTTTAGHLAVGGYMDSYYGYSFSKPASGAVPYFV
ncbi:MAG: hypothetical protein ACKO96_15850, partial [Flammeovirgaceae bacterium]